MKKNKKVSWKDVLRHPVVKKKKQHPKYVIKLREEYIKRGKFSNPHKKFLNILINHRII